MFRKARNFERLHFLPWPGLARIILAQRAVLSSELGAPILDRGQKKLNFGTFWLGLSNFWIGAWLPFDVFQFNLHFTAVCDFRLDFEQFTTNAPADTDEANGGLCQDILTISTNTGKFIDNIQIENAGNMKSASQLKLPSDTMNWKQFYSIKFFFRFTASYS